jgi:hypothetical protein
MKVVTRARGLLEKGKAFPVFFHVRVSYCPFFTFLWSSFTPCLSSHTLLCQALRNLQIAFGPLLDGHTLEEVTLWADEIYEESDINLTKGSPLKTKTDHSLTNTTLGLVVLDDIVEVVLPGTRVCVCVLCVCVCARARAQHV